MSYVSVRYIVDDVDAAIEFYSQHLGFDVLMNPAPGFAALKRDELRLLLNAPGAGGAGQAMPDGRQPEPGGWNRIQLQVDDLDATVERLKRVGVESRSDAVSGKGGRQILVADPSGNLIELFEPHRAGRAAPRVSSERQSPTPTGGAAQPHDPDAVQHAVTVDAPPEVSFTTFIAELDTWWPAEYTWAQDALETIRIEPAEGGRCFERASNGFECDWGSVLECDPPHRLHFLWQISPGRAPEPDPEKASEVEVRFEGGGPDSTRVVLRHSGFANHGADGEEYRASMGSPNGWPLILDRYRSAVS